MIIDLSLYEVSVVPAIIAVLFALKQTKKVATSLMPTISLLLGVLLCGAIGQFTIESILTGLIVGGLAVGVHSGTKNSLENYLGNFTKKEE